MHEFFPFFICLLHSGRFSKKLLQGLLEQILVKTTRETKNLSQGSFSLVRLEPSARHMRLTLGVSKRLPKNSAT